MGLKKINLRAAKSKERTFTLVYIGAHVIRNLSFMFKGPELMTRFEQIRNKSNIATALCRPLRFAFPSHFLLKTYGSMPKT